MLQADCAAWGLNLEFAGGTIPSLPPQLHEREGGRLETDRIPRKSADAEQDDTAQTGESGTGGGETGGGGTGGSETRENVETRRGFLGKSAAGAAAFGLFHIVPRHVLGGPDHVAPSEVITHGILGCGGISGSGAHVRPNKPGRPPETLAVCDVDERHLAQRFMQAGKGCTPYRDWRQVLERTDIDVIHICTPPHWHAPMSVAAAEAGFDIWCEKPMSRTIGEGQRVVEAVQRHGRMFRLNTWFRFQSNLYGFGRPALPLKKLVASGLLGWPLRVHVSRETGFDWKMFWIGRTDLIPQRVPSHFDYDMWLGPAPRKPYHPHRTHGSFRGYWDYDGGGLADMGQHYLDPVQYILGKDDTSPTEIEAVAPWPQHPDACGKWNKVTLRYEDGCEIVLDAGNPSGRPYIEGPKGKVFPGLRTEPGHLADAVHDLPDPQPMITRFEDSVRSRKKFALHESNGHRSCTLVNLANIAIRTGRKLRFDPVKQRFIGDDAANLLVEQPMRAPWRV